MSTRTITDIDRGLIDEFASAGRLYVQIPEDEHLVRKHLRGNERPARRLSEMAARGQMVRVAHGAYVLLPAGARSLGQAADRRVLVAAAFENRWAYYLGFASAIVDHGLTDESAGDLYVGVGGPRLPKLGDMAGTPLHLTRVAYDSDGRDRWLGVERERIRGQTFYVRSGIERTLIDALDRPGLCVRPEMWVRSWERALRERDLDLPLLLDLARRRSRAVSARAALLLREAGRPREARLLVDRPLTGRVLFDASNTEPGKWPRDRDTGLLLNVPLQAIDAWLEYGK
jgi:predicted transcriptional regulator of viral defense system